MRLRGGKRWGAFWLSCVCGTLLARDSYPEVSALPVQTALPDPLVTFDGRHVASAEQWFKERRPELQGQFEHYMYGAIPPKPPHTKAVSHGEYHDFLGGKATLKLFSLEPVAQAQRSNDPTIQPSPTGNAPRISLMVIVPNERKRPEPVFLAMNFCGNEALSDDRRIPLTISWLASSCKGCTNNRATDAGRGSQATNWPLAEMVERGYALASFYSGDIDSDRANVSDGIYAWLAAGDPARNNPTNRGTLAAWAWGFQRCVDYLVTDQDLDARRIAAVGHSRNGKTALLAAAFDERITMVFPHQAGCGGTAPSRGKTGESVKVINAHFPHWFNGRFKEFGDAPERLPFDQNCLVALCAPRPVLFSNAEDDQWSNPGGQFDVLLAADPVYRFLGVEGYNPQAGRMKGEAGNGKPAPGPREMPQLRQLVPSRLGYYIREGKHSMTADDWRVFMEFADRNWAKP